MTTISGELNDIQAIVRGMGLKMRYARFLYVRIDNQIDGRSFLAELGPPTSIENVHPLSNDVRMNLAFTYSGLKNLGVTRDVLATFPEEFVQGMAYRANDNGDVRSSNPENWDTYWTGRGIDIWIGLYSMVCQRDLDRRTNEIKKFIDDENLNVEITAEQEASKNFLGDTKVYIEDPATQPMPDPKMVMEHFGFRDSVTTPAIEGIWDGTHPNVSTTRVAGNGKYEHGRWRPLAAGEFVLGHIDEVNEIPIAPQPTLLSHNSSFMVLRKLHQHVDEFRKYMRKISETTEVSADYVAQKMIGRHRDGSNFLDPNRTNNFIYKDDMAGHRCPLGAHIRRANPRDKTEAEVNSDRGQGLIFIAIGASIARQFEFVQRQWINYGNDLDQGDDRDPVIGDNDGSRFSRMSIPADAWNEPTAHAPVLCSEIPRFVETKGGDYFFLPGLRAVKSLHQGSFIEPEIENP